MRLTGIIIEKGLHVFDGEIAFYNNQKEPRIWFIVTNFLNAYVYRRTPYGLELIATAACKAGVQNGVNPLYAERAEPGFVNKLAAWLESIVKEGVMDRFVLVASSHLLERLRPCLGHAAAARVSAEIAKDLTHLPKASIQHLLKSFT